MPLQAMAQSMYTTMIRIQYPPTAPAQQRLQACYQDVWQEASVEAAAELPDSVVEAVQSVGARLKDYGDLPLPADLDRLLDWHLLHLLPADAFASDEGDPILHRQHPPD